MGKRRRNHPGQQTAAQPTSQGDPVKMLNDALLPPEAVEYAKAFVAARATNGLAEVLGAPTGLGFGGPGLRAWEPVSSANTIFRNLRYYLVSNFRQVLSEAFAEIGLINTIVTIPVDDAFRGGVELRSKQLDEDQLKELADAADRNDDLTRAAEACYWSRLFGGGSIIPLIADQDPYKPLNIAAIGPDTEIEFRPTDLWELFWDSWSIDGDPYGANIDLRPLHYSYYGERVHNSRVFKIKGMTAPSWVRPRLRGWGLSVVEILVRSVNQYLKATDLGFQVLDEFKLDIYKIKGFNATLMNPAASQKMQERVQIGNWQKNYQNALMMDAEDDYDHKQLNFAGLAEAMQGIRMQVAADMRMPMLKLFGTPAQGLNASDEESLEVYNSMVESQVRNKIKHILLKMFEIRSQQLFGMVPDDLSLRFKPLRVLSAVNEETVKTQKFTRIHTSYQSGLITNEEFREACNKGELFDITLDMSESAIREIEDQQQAEKEAAMGDQGSDKTENAIVPYTRNEKIDRVLKNSAAFDRASYEADGGDSWIDPRRKEFFSNPGNVDEALWAKAKKASMEAFGEERWAFIEWWYRKHGGKHT